MINSFHETFIEPTFFYTYNRARYVFHTTSLKITLLLYIYHRMKFTPHTAVDLSNTWRQLQLNESKKDCLLKKCILQFLKKSNIYLSTVLMFSTFYVLNFKWYYLPTCLMIQSPRKTWWKWYTYCCFSTLK